jgi:hypothetical protein
LIIISIPLFSSFGMQESGLSRLSVSPILQVKTLTFSYGFLNYYSTQLTFVEFSLTILRSTVVQWLRNQDTERWHWEKNWQMIISISLSCFEITDDLYLVRTYLTMILWAPTRFLGISAVSWHLFKTSWVLSRFIKIFWDFRSLRNFCDTLYMFSKI